MALPNLKDQFLYELVPPLVATLDTRGLLQAVVGGLQDRVADLRSYASRYAELTEPDPAPYTCVLVQYTSDPGGTLIPVTLDVTATTPDDASALPAWAAEQLQIDVERVASAIIGTDALRTVGVDTVQLLAQSVGATLYPGLPGEDPAVVADRQRQALASYFPRLKVKGTPKSFALLARLAGFSDGALTPLWTRLSPREPADLGAPPNRADFSARPDIWPSASLPDPVYDPQSFCDGPYYAWSSGSLLTTPDSPQFYLTAVNGRNPFIDLAAGGSVSHPAPGAYVLSGGAPGRRAAVALSSGTVVSGLAARALTEGGSFNGLRVQVTGDGTWRELSIEAQLSVRKYRSSHFDLSLWAEEAGTRAVSINPDLAALPTLTSDGTAVAPFRPWGGGEAGVVARQQVAGTVIELDQPALLTAAQHVYAFAGEVQAATRFPRQTNVGPVVRERMQFAAFPGAAVLAVTTGTGVYSGTVPEFDRPTGDYEAGFSLNDAALATQSVVAGSYTFAGNGLSGAYTRVNGIWSAEVTATAGVGTLRGLWSPPPSDQVRAEPTLAQKMAGTVAYAPLPEGSLIDAYWQGTTWDDVPWLRPLRAGGEEINADMWLGGLGDPDPVVQTTKESRVRDRSGVSNRAFVYDLNDVPSPPFMRLTTEPAGAPVTVTLAGSGTGTNLYPVIGVSPTTVIAEASWTPGRSDRTLLWWPLTENPFQPRTPVPALGLAPDEAWLRPSDRQWDAERGWALQLSSGGTVALPRIGWPDNYAFAVTAKTSAVAQEAVEPAVRVGAADLLFDSGRVTLRVADPTGPLSVSLPLVGGTNALLCVNVGTDYASLHHGDRYGWQASATMSCQPGPGWTGARLTAGPLAVQLQDFMAWEGSKTTEDLESMRAPRLTASPSGLARSYVGGVTGDRWALEVLPSGFVVPAHADAVPVPYPTGEVRRYRGTGRYEGNSAYRQVGLGGAQTVPAEWRLGGQGPALPATGQVVVAGTWGEPGINADWSGTTGTVYGVTPPYGPTGGNTIITALFSGSGTVGLEDWPPALSRYNPAYDRIYLRGLTGFAYEVTLDDVGQGPQLAATIPMLPRPEAELPFLDSSLHAGRAMIGDFETRLREQAYELTVNSSGTVISQNTGGLWLLTEDDLYLLDEEEARFLLESEFSTRPVYLYLNSRVKVWATSAAARWVNPVPYGQEQGLAARDAAGLFEFENPEALAAGFYRLSVDAGNIGTVDGQFTGFAVQATLLTGETPVTFPVTLLPLGRGANPRGWTQVEFTLPVSVPGPWRLVLNWTNDRDVPSRGEFRRLAIYQYTLRRLASELHQVRAHPFTITPVDVSAPPVQAGAYVATYNSYGTIVSYAHEQNLYTTTAGEDTFNNPRSPYSNTLTGSTLQRRDSLDLITPWQLPDPPTTAAPTAGTLTVSPVSAYYNVGDVVTLANLGATGVTPLRRAWHLWSAGTYATNGTELTAIIDRGGTLEATVEVVDPYGRVARTENTIISNPQPVIALATASLSSSPVPYSTRLTAVVSDEDPLAVHWYRVSPYTLIGSGTTVPDYTVDMTQRVRVVAIDSRGGTATADVPLTGGVNGAPRVTLSQVSPTRLKAYTSIPNVFDVSVPQKLTLSALAFDPENRGVSPQWTFWDSALNGPGSVQPLPFFGGGTLCSIEPIIYPTAQDTPGVRGFSLTVTDGDGQQTVVSGEIPFTLNQLPVVTELAVSSTAVQAGELVFFSAVAHDPDGDEIDYYWEFPVLNLTLAGPNVTIDTTGLAGYTLGGRLKVKDNFGGITIQEAGQHFPNVVVYQQGLSALSMDPAGGLTAEGVNLTISSPDLPDSTIEIRYTLDGFPPVTVNDGQPYRWPVSLPYHPGVSLPVNARAFKAGVAPSPLASVTFTFQ
jgi:hypothetical protein